MNRKLEIGILVFYYMEMLGVALLSVCLMVEATSLAQAYLITLIWFMYWFEMTQGRKYREIANEALVMHTQTLREYTAFVDKSTGHLRKFHAAVRELDGDDPTGTRMRARKIGYTN